MNQTYIPKMNAAAVRGNSRNQRGFFLAAVMFTLAGLLPSFPVQAMDVFRTAADKDINEPSGNMDNFLELQQAVTQLTQRFATLEVSIESRLSRLTDSAVKGDALLETLSARLGKVDALVEKVESLDSRLTQETSFVQATLRDTNRDLQNVANHLERLESRVKDEGRSRHETRSNLPSRSPTDAELLNTLVTRRFGEIERSIPRMFSEAFTSFQMTLTKHISKNVNELRREYQQGREELVDMSNRTLRKASEVEVNFQMIAKRVHDALQDTSNSMQSARDDIIYEIRKSPMSSLGELRPVLQQVNQSVAQSVAKAAEGLNFTLREEAARRRGTEDSMRSDYVPLHCPDPTTVAALQEVKILLQSVLKKSEDLRRGLTKQTSEGVDLLKLLHQRFSVLLRRMNTDPDHGQQLVAEMQDLGSLVESSYTAVLVAQNAFIDSCKRIQAEEPTLELKIAEILDKLVTDINLGHKFNRMQLNELRRLVEHLADANATSSDEFPQSESDGETGEILRSLKDSQELPTEETSSKLTEVRDSILKTIEKANLTVSRLEAVEDRVDTVSRDLVDIDWFNVRQKEPADQLVTAAKDLKGYARDQIIESLNLHQALLTTLEQITVINSSFVDGPVGNGSVFQSTDLDFSFPVYLNDEGYTPAKSLLTLPSTCTLALLEQVKNLPEFKKMAAKSPAPSLSDEEEDEEGEAEDEDDGEEEEDEDEDEDYEDEEDIPAWYTDPDFLSGNYGTPDLGFPVFREDEWRDISDYASDDYLYIERPSTTTSTTTEASSASTPPLPTQEAVTRSTPALTQVVTRSTSPRPRLLLPGGVDRFFGIKTTRTGSSRSKREATKDVQQ